jgi:hypothetical protein
LLATIAANMSASIDRSAPRFAMLSRNPGLACGVFALTATLHVSPWLLWPPSTLPRPEPPPTVRVSVLRLQAAPQRIVEAPRPTLRPRAVSRRTPQRVPEPSTPAMEEAGAAASPSGTAPAAPPQSTPGAPVTPLQLDSPAIRRAIRDAARGPSMADLGDAGPGVDRKLGEAIAAGARGDCLKGEYVGGGMGLLSLPFLAIAKLRDQCSK